MRVRARSLSHPGPSSRIAGGRDCSGSFFAYPAGTCPSPRLTAGDGGFVSVCRLRTTRVPAGLSVPPLRPRRPLLLAALRRRGPPRHRARRGTTVPSDPAGPPPPCGPASPLPRSAPARPQSDASDYPSRPHIGHARVRRTTHGGTGRRAAACRSGSARKTTRLMAAADATAQDCCWTPTPKVQLGGDRLAGRL